MPSQSAQLISLRNLIEQALELNTSELSCIISDKKRVARTLADLLEDSGLWEFFLKRNQPPTGRCYHSPIRSCSHTFLHYGDALYLLAVIADYNPIICERIVYSIIGDGSKDNGMKTIDILELLDYMARSANTLLAYFRANKNNDERKIRNIFKKHILPGLAEFIYTKICFDKSLERCISDFAFQVTAARLAIALSFAVPRQYLTRTANIETLYKKISDSTVDTALNAIYNLCTNQHYFAIEEDIRNMRKISKDIVNRDNSYKKTIGWRKIERIIKALIIYAALRTLAGSLGSVESLGELIKKMQDFTGSNDFDEQFAIASVLVYMDPDYVSENSDYIRDVLNYGSIPTVEDVTLGREVYNLKDRGVRVIIDPWDIRLQIRALLKVYSCLTPGGSRCNAGSAIIRELIEGRPYFFFGIIVDDKDPNNILGRFMIVIGRPLDGKSKYAITTTGEIYWREDLSRRYKYPVTGEVIREVLIRYASKYDLGYIRSGRLIIPRTKVLYNITKIDYIGDVKVIMHRENLDKTYLVTVNVPELDKQ